jgi:hypothetical protein
MMNCVIFLSSNEIFSSLINTSPVRSHPIVENTSILLPKPLDDNRSFSKRVFVETEKEPFTVSGARTIFQICSSSKVPSAKTLSTTAEA